VKLLDFGLSWVADGGERLTEFGTVIGTPAYMSPEQARGDRADARSDLFALGSVLYALCTGRDPFAGDSLYAVLEAVRTASPRPVRELNPSVPEGLVAVLNKLHAKDPADRFQSAAEVVRALEQAGGSASPKGGRKVYRFRMAAVAAAFLVLATGAACLLAGAFDAPPPRPAPASRGPAPAAPRPAAPVAGGEVALAQDQERPAPKEDAKAPAVYPAALFPFEERGAGVREYGAKVSDLLFARLAVKPDIYLVDRADLRKVQNELALGLSGVVQADKAARVGQLTGARLLISGSVIQVDKRLYLVAKIVGTETSRLAAASVDGKVGDELGPLVDKLADGIANQIKEQADKLVGRPAAKADRLAALRRALKKGPRPTVFVQVSERHVGAIRFDPAAQTELMRLCKATDFPVLDPETGLRARADVLLLGEALCETAARHGNLVSVKARVELRAVERKTDRVLWADSQTSLVVDLTEQVAGKAALEQAAAVLAGRVLPRLIKE
jgi:TolB-like protein